MDTKHGLEHYITAEGLEGAGDLAKLVDYRVTVFTSDIKCVCAYACMCVNDNCAHL